MNFLRRIKRVFGFKDIIKFKDEVIVEIIENNQVVKRFKVKGNTWTTSGLNYARDCIYKSTTAAYVNKMAMNGTGARADVSTSNSAPSSLKARFVGLWSTGGNVTGITQFTIKRDTTAYANISVSSFNLETDQSLKVTWTTTLS